MKWEEAIQELNRIIPQEAGYFTLEVEQFWHGDLRVRMPEPGMPTVKVCCNQGPDGGWTTFEAPTLKAMVDQIRVAYATKVAAPDAVEAETAEIVESGEGLAMSLEPDGTELERNPAGEERPSYRIEEPNDF